MNPAQFRSALKDFATRLRLEADLPLTVIGSATLSLLRAGETPTKEAIIELLANMQQAGDLHVEISPKVIATALEKLEDIAAVTD